MQVTKFIIIVNPGKCEVTRTDLPDEPKCWSFLMPILKFKRITTKYNPAFYVIDLIIGFIA